MVMTTQSPGSNVPSTPAQAERFRQAYDAIQAEMAAIPRDQLMTLNVDVASTVATTIGCLPKLASLRPQIVAEVGGFKLHFFDKLETYAMALMHAQAEYSASAPAPEPIDELNAELTITRDLFLKDVTALEARNLLEFRASELSGTPGFKHLTKDVLLLCSVLRNHWAAIQGRTAVVLEDLDEAEHKAKRLLAAVGLREQTSRAATAQAEMRQRAFTLFARAHDEVRRVVTYLRWHEDDANALFPTVFGGARKQARTERPTDGAPVSNASPPVASGSPSPAIKNTIPVGMPGSPPTD
jgi:hypothetical protein